MRNLKKVFCIKLPENQGMRWSKMDFSLVHPPGLGLGFVHTHIGAEMWYIYKVETGQRICRTLSKTCILEYHICTRTYNGKELEFGDLATEISPDFIRVLETMYTSDEISPVIPR